MQRWQFLRMFAHGIRIKINSVNRFYINLKNVEMKLLSLFVCFVFGNPIEPEFKIQPKGDSECLLGCLEQGILDLTDCDELPTDQEKLDCAKTAKRNYLKCGSTC